MSTLSDLLLGIVKPAVARGLAALGISLVTVTGVTAVFDSLRNEIITSMSGAPLDVLQLMGLAGVWDATGMCFGAITASVSYISITKFFKMGGA